MHPHLKSPYRQTSDAMTEHTLYSQGPRVERLETLAQLSGVVGALVLQEWEHTPGRAHHGLHAATTLACEPVMRSIIGQRPTQESAQAVEHNLYALNTFIDKVQLYEAPSDSLVGELAELSIVTLAWWGIANGYTSPNSYVLPATAKQDSGSSGGVRNGVDVVGKLNGKRVSLQVKNSITRIDEIYDRDIKLVSPRQLISLGNASHSIIRAHTSKHEPTLTASFKNLMNIIQPPTHKEVSVCEEIYSRRGKKGLKIQKAV